MNRKAYLVEQVRLIGRLTYQDGWPLWWTKEVRRLTGKPLAERLTVEQLESVHRRLIETQREQMFSGS